MRPNQTYKFYTAKETINKMKRQPMKYLQMMQLTKG